jgi:hypothetical protein
MPNNVTTDLSNWKYQDNYVERIMDNAAYTAAHPDDTIVLVGPPRVRLLDEGDPTKGLKAIGMMQAFQASQQKPTVPVQAIGTGRSFFVSSKSSIQWNVGRLFVKGKNLIRALNENAIAAGVDVKTFDEPIVPEGASGTSDYFVNLDSELLLIPFGLAVLFRDKSHNHLGGFYLELCVLQSWAVGLNAGQNMIMENVSGQCDRLMPFSVPKTPDNHETSDSIDEKVRF